MHPGVGQPLAFRVAAASCVQRDQGVAFGRLVDSRVGSGCVVVGIDGDRDFVKRRRLAIAGRDFKRHRGVAQPLGRGERRLSGCGVAKPYRRSRRLDPLVGDRVRVRVGRATCCQGDDIPFIDGLVRSCVSVRTGVSRYIRWHGIPVLETQRADVLVVDSERVAAAEIDGHGASGQSGLAGVPATQVHGVVAGAAVDRVDCICSWR